MPTISKGRTPLTFINVFTVAPENQDVLVELLSEVTGQNVRHHKGFISASLHRSVDGKKVTMYAQWARPLRITNPCVETRGPHRRWRRRSR